MNDSRDGLRRNVWVVWLTLCFRGNLHGPIVRTISRRLNPKPLTPASRARIEREYAAKFPKTAQS